MSRLKLKVEIYESRTGKTEVVEVIADVIQSDELIHEELKNGISDNDRGQELLAGSCNQGVSKPD